MILRQTQASAEQVKIRIEGMMNARMSSLDLLAERWVDRTPPDFSKLRFIQFAKTFFGHYPGFFGINWIDPYGTVQWTFPQEYNTDIVNKNIHDLDTDIRNTFETVRQTLKFKTTPCHEMRKGEITFDTFWPLIYKNKINGYLNGAFHVQDIMDICIAKNISNNFSIMIYEDDRLIYMNLKEPKTKQKLLYKQFVIMEGIRFPGKIWKMHFEPRKSLFKFTTIPNQLYLLFGLIISATLSVVFFLLLQRIEMYRNARNSAFEEIEKRKISEAALQKNEIELKNTMEKLVAKNTEMESFLYSISHDLKTPIVTIDGFIGALREDFGNDLPESAEGYFQYISEATKKMGLLINDLIELSRIGRVNEKKMPLQFGEIVESAMSMLKPQIEAKGISINIGQNLPAVYGEKKRLIQLVENLLSNAIKYIGKDNPSPEIEIGHKKDGEQDVFFVKDNGIGIQHRYQKIIFQVFQRLPDAKKAGEGTGIGLAIVARIIKHHNGEIRVSSEPGQGSTFFFTLNNREV
ncbi:MAG: sensor histidine kinase [Proteobacteria bacterium]|nr:sensor histidine kinase [Pseudomonadota bacterium]